MSSAQDPPSDEGPVTAGRNGATGPPEPDPPPERRPGAEARARTAGEPSRPADPTDPVGPDRPAAGPAEPAESAEPAGASRLAAELARLTVAVEREHERAAHREAVIDRLHEDVQTLRRGELQALFDPVRAVLYRLHDLTGRESRRWVDDPPDPGHAAALLAAVSEEIAEALARTGVERFATRPGDPFDPARHRPVSVETVEDPALDGTVVGVCADGFERAGRVVRKAEVRVGRPPSTGRDPAAGPAPLSRSNDRIR
ncbi:nucleotide exchange factor GrpE [Thermomonospora echinospora]|uniref:nucleotide exchange factor GrpE n=1 Tax=Thermomonospora echinospora TaxID=1992 RepID=UPI001F29D779|nr:nucleotide exchange factor GrpE [Thermomonospora echinospora]